MKHDTPITDADLHAYVDDQLSPTRRRHVEAWLAEHPEATKEVEDYRRQAHGIHALYDPVLEEPLPAGMTAVRRPVIYRRIAAAAAWLVVGALAGWFGHNLFSARGDQALRAHLVKPAVFAHSVYVTDGQRPVELERGQEQQLIDWLSARLRTEIRAPNLAALGYELIGGRLLPSTDRMAAQFMYQDRQDNRITLYIRRISDVDDGSAFHYAAEGDVKTFFWIDGPLGYAVSGNIDKQTLFHLADAVYRQLVS